MSSESGSSVSSIYPSLENGEPQQFEQSLPQRGLTPPPPFTPEAQQPQTPLHHPMPSCAVIRQHSFAAEGADLEKAPTAQAQRGGRICSAWCKTVGWFLLGCIVGLGLAESRHYYLRQMQERQNTRPAMTLRDPDTVELSHYFK